MTIIETAKVLGLKVRTIRKWIKNNKIRAEKRNGRWYIFEEEISKKEIQQYANSGREHSRRIKESASMGMRE